VLFQITPDRSCCRAETPRAHPEALPCLAYSGRPTLVHGGGVETVVLFQGCDHRRSQPSLKLKGGGGTSPAGADTPARHILAVATITGVHSGTLTAAQHMASERPHGGPQICFFRS
jgi:hypothetical protein